jgi:hypothetical protein
MPPTDPASPDAEAALPRIGALPTRVYRFDDLNMQVDHRLQLEPSGAQPGAHFYARLIGFLKGSSLIVKLPPGWNEAAPLSEDDTVLVRGFSGRIAYAFNSTVLKIRYLPYAYCHLSYPEEIQGAEIRKAVRIRMQMPALASNLKIGNSVEATITDLSAIGVQLDSPQQLGAPGDDVSISFRFWLQPNDYEVNFNALGIIQSAQSSDAGTWSHGIRFHNMRSTEAILLQSLIYEQLVEKRASIA